jgi:hypothetical protein
MLFINEQCIYFQKNFVLSALKHVFVWLILKKSERKKEKACNLGRLNHPLDIVNRGALAE